MWIALRLATVEKMVHPKADSNCELADDGWIPHAAPDPGTDRNRGDEGGGRAGIIVAVDEIDKIRPGRWCCGWTERTGFFGGPP